MRTHKDPKRTATKTDIEEQSETEHLIPGMINYYVDEEREDDPAIIVERLAKLARDN